jgi:hypothetical protein
MLLSTFIAELSGNQEQQVRYQIPATGDQAFQIEFRVFEAEAQEKINLAFFFRNVKPTEKVEATLVSPGRPLENQSTNRLLVITETRRM